MPSWHAPASRLSLSESRHSTPANALALETLRIISSATPTTDKFKPHQPRFLHQRPAYCAPTTNGSFGITMSLIRFWHNTVLRAPDELQTLQGLGAHSTATKPYGYTKFN